jgi:hypothetical protein
MTDKPDKEEKPLIGKPIGKPVGTEWINPVSGLLYRWDGRCWKSTGRYPYGPNPMGLLGE